MPANLPTPNILELTTDRHLESVNLNNCDREPIHIPNLIQPHGVLISVSADTYEILQVSLNSEQMLGIKPEDLLNQPLSRLLGEQATEIQQCSKQDFSSINPLTVKLVKQEGTVCFSGVVHYNGTVIILELEPNYTPRSGSVGDFYRLIKSPVDKIQRSHSLDELCQAIAQEIKSISGFARVMVYQFDKLGAGKVVAEALEPELEPFLGLHYPDTDIPKQAKYLYTLNYLRLIPDAAYEPVGITPRYNPLTNQPLNMSQAGLRSVSPLHTEYLDNMGVAASMSVSLIKNNQLWGLIACHHTAPIRVSYEVRTVCEFLGHIASVELAAKENSEDAEYKIKLKSIQSQFVSSISQAEDLRSSLTENNQRLLDLVGASGAALSFDNKITTIGQTPEIAEVESLISWLPTQFTEEVIYETTELAKAYPAAADYSQVASGILALLISRVERTMVVWFRPEVIQTVDWGGNPEKAVVVAEDGTMRMSPRKSFAKWQETVTDTALAWKPCELEAALELRSSIVGIVLRKADELAQVNRELSRSNTELDAFAYIASHDLKEPLRGIYNYSSFLIEDYGEILGEDGKDKLNTLMRLTHRMEDLINSLLRYSRLGRAELNLKSVNLNDLLAGVLDVIKASARDTQVEFKIPRSLPTVDCDRTQVNELFTNLISNGIKYNKENHKVIEIGYLEPNDLTSDQLQSIPLLKVNQTIFYVADNGIGIREKHLETIFRIFKRLHGQKKFGGGTGAGLTIAKKIVERHGGEIWVKSVYQAGSTFYFTLQ